MDAFENRILAAWPPSQWRSVPVLIAVSGGADSTALARALVALQRNNAVAQAGGSLIMAHFNHRWRGEESDCDADFVAQLARECDIPSVIGHAPTSAGPGSEEEARQLRYAFLEKTAREQAARYLVLAHTADDQVETVLFRLLRGTGVAGLAGMPRVRALSPMTSLVRPLLAISRDDVIAYLARIGQSFRHDSSNDSLDYARNRIRHTLLPRLERDCCSEIRQRLLDHACRAAELHLSWREEALELWSEAVDVSSLEVSIRTPALLRRSVYVVRELFVQIWDHQHWPRGEMSQNRWQELYLLAIAVSSRGSRMFPGAIVAMRSGDRLLIGRFRIIE